MRPVEEVEERIYIWGIGERPFMALLYEIEANACRQASGAKGVRSSI